MTEERAVTRRITVSYAGRRFAVAQAHDQAGFKGAITYEKRALNRAFAQHVLGPDDRVLDAFAGYGISTYDWLTSGATVLAVERNARHFQLATGNLLRPFPRPQLTLRRADNMRVLKELNQSGEKFDMVDLDPFGNAFEQAELALPLIHRGFLWMTSGEHVNIRRKLNQEHLRRRYGKAVDPFYERTVPVTAFPYVIEAWVKTQRQEARLVNFCMSPGCLRMLFAINRSVPRAFLRAWSPRQKLFGGLERGSWSATQQ